MATVAELDDIDREAKEVVREAVEFAEKSPTLTLEELERMVYG